VYHSEKRKSIGDYYKENHTRNSYVRSSPRIKLSFVVALKLMIHLEGEAHQTWVEHQWKQKVRCNVDAQWKDGLKLGDAPERWQSNRANNHKYKASNAVDERVLELLDDLWHFLEERSIVNFLCGGSPRHVDTEKV